MNLAIDRDDKYAGATRQSKAKWWFDLQQLCPLGRRLCYTDLSLFQVIEGLRYAFPKRMKRFE